ncbi:MAG: site-specific integrase [Lachnospiraceae bacterium]|nr:site-specific integrase [Lachnospiraceae bacterium]
MTIEKLKSGSYRITEMYKGRRYRKTLSYKPTKKEAQLLIDEMIEHAAIPSKSVSNMKEAAAGYIAMKSNVLSPTTITAYQSIVKNLSDGFLSLKIIDVDAVAVQTEINNYSVGRSPKSTRNAHGFISAVLSVYRPGVSLHTTLPQKKRYDAYTPTDNDIKRILERVKDTKYDIPFRLGCYGLRRSEICALTSADLNGETVTIDKSYVQNENKEWIIRPFNKTAESTRSVTIDSDLAGMIRSSEGRLFPLHPESLNAKLHEIQDFLGIRRFRFHDLRAYFASSAHALGIPDAYIMAAGGWSSPYVMNRVYRRTMSDVQKEMSDRLVSHMGAM